MTVLEVLQATTAYFKKHSIESPRLNAEHLLAHVLDRKRIDLYLEFERVLTDSELAPLRALVKRRNEAIPWGFNRRLRQTHHKSRGHTGRSRRASGYSEAA